MIVALTHDQPLLRPYDLRTDGESTLCQTVSNDGRTECPMPDISNLAGEEVPSWGPVRNLVVADLAFSRRVVDTSAVTPFRVVFDTIGWVRDHQLRHRAGK